MKTLGELILTDYAAARPILEAWERGEPLERYDPSVGEWFKKQQAEWATLVAVYRIPRRHHTVDWSQVGDRIVAFDTNKRGYCYGIDVDDEEFPTDLWPSFRPGTMPWQESRIERPKEVK